MICLPSFIRRYDDLLVDPSSPRSKGSSKGQSVLRPRRNNDQLLIWLSNGNDGKQQEELKLEPTKKISEKRSGKRFRGRPLVRKTNPIVLESITETEDSIVSEDRIHQA